MAEETDKAVKEEGGVPAAPAAAPRAPLFSPAGWLIVLVVVAAEAVLVFMVGQHFGKAGTKATDETPVSTAVGTDPAVAVQLDEIGAQLFSGPGKDRSAKISFRFVVEIEPGLQRDEQVKIEKRVKDTAVQAEIAYILRDQDFERIEQKIFPEEVAKKVKDHLNGLIGPKIREVKVLEYTRYVESSQ